MDAHSLKEQLSEKSLRVYELELYSAELAAQVKELSDVKDKLMVANRNSRTLEEENSNVIMRLKKLDGGKIDPSFFPSGIEAAKLIRENEELRASLRDLNASLDKVKGSSKTKETDLEKQLQNATEHCDRMVNERERQGKELESARRQCVDLQRALDEEKDTAHAAADLWEQERERYEQKIDDLLASAKRAERFSATADSRPRERPNGLQELLLKEEVEQLEKKLKVAEDRLWSKEKEWVRAEADLRCNLTEAHASVAEAGNEREVYRSLQDQIAALKREILQLRGEKRAARPMPFMPMDSDISSLRDGFTAPSGARGVSGPGGRAGGPGGDGALEGPAMQQLNELAADNDAMRDEIHDLKMQLLDGRLATEEKNVQVKELEAALAAAGPKRNGSASGVGSRRGGGGYSATASHNGDADINEQSYMNRMRNPEREVADLRKKVRDAQKELGDTRASLEQKNAVNEARLKECHAQIDELLQENATLYSNGGGGGAGSGTSIGGGDDEFPDHFMSVIRLSRDKRESVEDVMRLLESSWENETDAMRQARLAKMQGAAMASHDAMRDEEMRRLQAIIDELRDRLNAAEADRDANDDLRDRIRDLEDAIAALRRQKEREAKEADALRKEADAFRKEADALRKQMRDTEGKDRDADGKNRDDLRRMQEENNKLRRQLARSPARLAPSNGALSQLSVRSSDEKTRAPIPEGAHLAVTVVELCDVMRNGGPLTEPGYIIIKLKSIKEKYKTSVRELSSVIRFDESFEFYLAQPDQDVITLHVFYKPKDSNREYHIGDACFSMATLCRGIARQRIAPVAQCPGTKEACMAAQIEVTLQTDDFGRMVRPTEADIEDETHRFNEMVTAFETSAPEKLHAVDVYMASRELM